MSEVAILSLTVGGADEGYMKSPTQDLINHKLNFQQTCRRVKEVATEMRPPLSPEGGAPLQGRGPCRMQEDAGQRRSGSVGGFDLGSVGEGRTGCSCQLTQGVPVQLSAHQGAAVSSPCPPGAQSLTRPGRSVLPFAPRDCSTTQGAAVSSPGADSPARRGPEEHQGDAR